MSDHKSPYDLGVKVSDAAILHSQAITTLNEQMLRLARIAEILEARITVLERKIMMLEITA